MKKTGIIISLIFTTLLCSCNFEKKSNAQAQDINQAKAETDTLTKHLKAFRKDLPTIGLLMYNGVLQSEVIATSDVFSKPSEEGKQLFNVVTIAETEKPITTVVHHL